MFKKLKTRFKKRLNKLIDFGMLGTYSMIIDDLKNRYSDMPDSDIDVLAAAIVNEIFQKEQIGKSKDVKLKNPELIDAEVLYFLKNEEILESAALCLRIMAMVELSDGNHSGLNLLDKANEIDPGGNIPSGKEISNLLKELRI
ncbi:MAG: hypothetical protein JW794_04820 [Candidatus Cloacimonetes bacterium]|nr:hypothetical protein [Candidatus Cloacimonadota bacterium]